MRIVLDGDSVEVRAYLAAQVGPSRRPFGNPRLVAAQAGTATRIAQNGTGNVLFVSVLAVSGPGAFAQVVFSSNGSPSRLTDPTVDMSYRDRYEDFVVLPGEELWIQNQAGSVVSFSVVQVTF